MATSHPQNDNVDIGVVGGFGNTIDVPCCVGAYP